MVLPKQGVLVGIHFQTTSTSCSGIPSGNRLPAPACAGFGAEKWVDKPSEGRKIADTTGKTQFDTMNIKSNGKSRSEPGRDCRTVDLISRSPFSVPGSKFVVLRGGCKSSTLLEKMNKIIFASVTVIGFLLPRTTQAQGILYVSNLGQSMAGGEVIGSNSWVAQTFVTGPSAGGYVLNSVQLLMGAPSGTPGGFNVSIYSKTGDPHSEQEPGDSPAASLGNLIGPEPTKAGVFGYTNPGIILAPSTFYYAVVTAATSTSDGSYGWSGTTGLTQSNGFTIDDECFNSTNGSGWTWTPRKITFRLGLYASAVPPPNLSVLRDGTANLKILWPNSGTYVLEQSTNLGTTNWIASGCTVTNNVLTNFCNVAPAGAGLFFRLGQHLP